MLFVLLIEECQDEMKQEINDKNAATSVVFLS